MKKTTTIYALVDPRSTFVRYVGKSDNPSRRLRAHVCEAHKGIKRDHKNCWIRSVLAMGFRPTLLILEVVNVSVWKEREQYWIKYWEAAGSDLTNSKDGGDGGNVSEVSRRRQSEARRGKVPWNKGRETPSAVREKQSAAARARCAKDPELVRRRVEAMGKARPAPALSFDQVRTIRRMLEEDQTAREISETLGYVSTHMVYKIKHGKKYRTYV